jgi:DNA polymerase-4
MDAFYAAVEVLDHPDLRGRPVIAGGSRDGTRGVVCSATYEAREYGVRSAMPAVQAKQLCPHAVFMPLRFPRYESLSREIHAIFDAYTPRVQPVSIDEAFLDLGSRGGFDAAVTTAREIKSRILGEVGLTASVGVAPGKALAKIASDLQKPDGFVVVRPGGEEAFLEPLSVGRIWGVGPRTRENLEKLGIQTIGELRRLGPETLKKVFGKYGEALYRISRGIDRSKIRTLPESERKSISAQNAFGRPRRSWEEYEEILLELAERVTSRARKKGFLARCITLGVRTPDFRSASRSVTVDPPTNATEHVFRAAAGLLRRMRSVHTKFTRLGIGLSRLLADEGIQGSLFDGKGDEAHRRIDRVLDEVREKLGRGALSRARLLDHRPREGGPLA